MVTVRRLSKSDAEKFRSIRLEGLKRYPESFGASFSVEAAESLDFFADRLERDAMFGAFIDRDLCGVAGFYSFQHEKAAHNGVLYGMYVRDQTQGMGLGYELVQAVLSHARNEVERVQLSVIASNHRARRVYEKCGFEVYGIEPNALKVADKYLDEALMSISLK